MERYPDGAGSGLDPLLHFVLAGADERRDPNPLFDTTFHRAEKPDFAKSRSNPLMHYIRRGASENRNPHLLFHTAFYTQHNSDVPLSGINPLRHYLSFGHQEGRNPNPLFNGSYHIGSKAYGMKPGANPLIYYLRRGTAARINAHPEFHTSYYTRKYLRLGLTSELIQDDDHGYLYDSGDPQGLNTAMIKAGAASLAVEERMRTACSDFAATCDWRSTWDDRFRACLR